MKECPKNKQVGMRVSFVGETFVFHRIWQHLRSYLKGV